MAFWGCSFIYDGIPCEQFELMLYDIGNHSQSNVKFASPVTIVEEKTALRWKPYFYGTNQENKLTFTMVFGVNETRANNHEFLDRYEMEAVSSWLTGHNEYMWLEIMQEDMNNVRYRCMITGLEVIEYGQIPWAYSATVECDSPYAYKYPEVFEYDVNGLSEIDFYNSSSHNGYYMPIIEISLSSGTSFEITNLSDSNRTMSFNSLPTALREICIDNDYGIVTSGDSGLNPYPYFNFKFLRLIRGENRLRIVGNGKVKIICEFPVNIGG